MGALMLPSSVIAAGMEAVSRNPLDLSGNTAAGWLA